MAGMARIGKAWKGKAGNLFKGVEMSKKPKYEFRSGARYSVDPAAACKELERIHHENGVLEAQTVVDESAPEDAPLHKVFEWDDSKAANSYRLVQSRTLIKSVRVVREVNKPSVPIYVHVPSETESNVKAGYQPMSVVVTRPDMYASALAALTSKFQSAKFALEELKHAAVNSPDTDHERMARIEIAVQAMQTASAAVSALH